MPFLDSPFIIPVVAMMVPIVAIIAGAYSRVSTERYRSEQRRDMLARGIPLDQIDRSMGAQPQNNAQSGRPCSPARTAGQIRLAAIICIFTGLSITIFFCVLAAVLHVTQIYAGAASGIIPFGIGLGFWVDYRSRLREIARMREEGQL